jgi:hypothetical protein
MEGGFIACLPTHRLSPFFFRPFYLLARLFFALPLFSLIVSLFRFVGWCCCSLLAYPKVIGIIALLIGGRVGHCCFVGPRMRAIGVLLSNICGSYEAYMLNV